MLTAFGRAFKTPDLRRKILFTLFIIGVYRLGSYVPGPGVSYVAIQRALDSYDGVAPDVRIGLHVGTAFEREGEDLGGEAVHAAARIAALGGPGDILGSRETFADGAARFRISEARSVELKGVSQPVEVVSVDWR